jgi:hypothetical protein
VDVAEISEREFLALAFKVGDLTGDERLAARGVREFLDNGGMRVARGGFYGRGHLEGDGEEGVASEDGDAFTVDLVRGGLAAAKVVVVHAGQVVMDERVGVDAFDRAGEGKRRLRLSTQDFGRREADDGTQALAAREDAVSHRLMNRFRARGGGGQETIERGIDLFLAGRPITGKIHAWVMRRLRLFCKAFNGIDWTTETLRERVTPVARPCLLRLRCKHRR